MGSIGSIIVDAGGTGYTGPTVAILDAYGTGDGLATATIDPLTQIDTVTGGITGITVTNAGSGYSAPIVVITDGEDTASAETTLDKLVRKAQLSEVLIYSIGLLDNDDPRGSRAAATRLKPLRSWSSSSAPGLRSGCAPFSRTAFPRRCSG
jgi:hypothetical protein